MGFVSVAITGGGLIVALLIIGFSVYSLRIGDRSIFNQSGAPTSMAQILLSSVHITSQHLVGILIIVVLSLLMLNRILDTEAGLPLLSVIVGYLLGKTFKDIALAREKKEQGTS